MLTLPGWFTERLELFRLRVARTDAIAELSLLGILSGVLAASVIILFRFLVEAGQEALLHQQLYDYEHMAPGWRLVSALAGGAALGLLFQLIPAATRRVGVPHLIERLDYQQGRLPLGAALVQFVGGSVALISGQSVGREGPSIHLGAAASNIPAQWLALPNNALRMIAICGAAAGIAATFNTPLAGVAFAMEVLMMESTVAAFAPVILATISATTLTRLAFGDDIAFTVPALSLGSLTELLLPLLIGLFLGVVAALFTLGLQAVYRLGSSLPLFLRLLLAGLSVGLIAAPVPEVMGIGYDTVDLALSGSLGIYLPAVLVVAKLLATVLAVGLGVPGGLIGPSLVIGAMGGSLLAQVAHTVAFIPETSIGFHVMLGMGAMMAGTLQAPLAALLAILELTGNPNILFPGMLAVITATLTAGALQGRESVFQALLRSMGVNYRNDRIARILRQVGVAAVLDRSFRELPPEPDRALVEKELAESPRWILVRPEDGTPQLLPAVDLAQAIERDPEAESISLLDIPADRLDAAEIDFQANLQEAEEALYERGAQSLYVSRLTVPGLPRVFGILTRKEIDNGYRY